MNLTQSLTNNIYSWFTQSSNSNCIQKLSDNSILNIANDVNSVFADVTFNESESEVSLSKLPKLPRLVVVGTQSSGKSSVLNRIIGMNILPTGKNMVTRTPLELRLHKLTNIEEISRVEAGYYTSTGGWVVDANIDIDTPTPTAIQMDKISSYIKTRTVQLAGPGMDVCDKPIILEVYSPNVPNLSLIDLPGLTMVAQEDKGQPIDIKERIEALVTSYVKQEHTIILTVIQARPDLETDLGLALVKRHDKTGQHTIGVLTKPDLMNQGTHVGDYLIGSNISKNLMLTYGYYTVNNTSNLDGSFKEDSFFKDHKEYSKEMYKERVGLSNLTNSLCNILVSSISIILPSVIREISKLEETINKKLEIYGDDLPNTKDGKIHVLNRYVSDFNNFILDSIESRGSQINTGKLIKDAFVKYKTDMAKIQPFTSDKTNYTKRYFDDIVANLEGNHMAFHTSPVKLVEACFSDTKLRPIFHMSKPTLECVDRIHDIITSAVSTILNIDRFSKYPLLVSHINIIINERLLAQAKKETKDKVLEVLFNEEAYIWTDDSRFMNKLSECSVIDISLNSMTSLLNSYYSSIAEVVCHSVPKIVMNFMIRSVENNLLSFLISSTVNEGKIDLLQEDEDTDKQRKYYCNLRDRISSVKKRIGSS